MLAFGLLIGQAQGQEDIESTFQRLLQNPSDVELNLLYARLAEERGELARALATYERLLLLDPENATALAEAVRIRRLLEPSRTEYVAVLGYQYETNAPHREEGADRFGDHSGSAAIIVRDERTLGDRRIRTTAQLYGDAHVDFQEADLYLVSAQSGPLLLLPDRWQVRPAVALTYAALDREFLFYSAGVVANFEKIGPGILRTLDLRLALDDYNTDRNGRDATAFGIASRFQWTNLAAAAAQDVLSISPRYLFNGARGGGHRNRYHQIGAQAEYLYPVYDNVLAGPELTLWYRDYIGHDPDEVNNREDKRYAPGAKVIVSEFLRPEVTLVLRYFFEKNNSNDPQKKYKNHSFGVNVAWEF
ncbi:MAG: hypothetical protein ACE5KL_02630 [Alphaproteobacteria bacterium]